MERLELLAAHLDFRRRGVTTVLSVGLGVGNHGGGNAFALCIDRADVFQGADMGIHPANQPLLEQQEEDSFEAWQKRRAKEAEEPWAFPDDGAGSAEAA